MMDVMYVVGVCTGFVAVGFVVVIALIAIAGAMQGKL
jgi:hypothetical protein